MLRLGNEIQYAPSTKIPELYNACVMRLAVIYVRIPCAASHWIEKVGTKEIDVKIAWHCLEPGTAHCEKARDPAPVF